MGINRLRQVQLESCVKRCEPIFISSKRG